MPDIVGHSTLKQMLRTIDDLPSVALFIGPDGVGKTTFAKQLISPVVHPVDLTDLTGESKGTVAVFRLLIESIGRRPFASPFRVVLIDYDQVTVQASDTLLKLLEEPPAHVKFILISSTGRVPVTVLSRCRHYHFSGLSDDEVTKVLMKLGTAEGPARWSAERSNGSVKDALQLSFNEGRYREAETMVELLQDGQHIAYLNKIRGSDDLTVAMMFRVLIDKGILKHTRLLEANILSKTKLLLLGLTR